MQDNQTAVSDSEKENSPLKEKMTYRFGNRAFVVESVFKEESPETLGSVLLRLMKADSEEK